MKNIYAEITAFDKDSGSYYGRNIIPQDRKK